MTGGILVTGAAIFAGSEIMKLLVLMFDLETFQNFQPDSSGMQILPPQSVPVSIAGCVLVHTESFQEVSCRRRSKRALLTSSHGMILARHHTVAS
jgi:hypothetical protein